LRNKGKDASKASKNFSFKKKAPRPGKQKTFISCGRWPLACLQSPPPEAMKATPTANARRSKSFFGYFFFKKSNFFLRLRL
jgi:hypothetical protein